MIRLTLIQPDSGRRVKVMKRVCTSERGALRVRRDWMVALVIGGRCE